MSGQTQFDAARQARALLINAQRGSRKSVRVHIKRAERISSTIWCRFHVTPAVWKVKHIRWYCQHSIKSLSQHTQYDHWLTIIRLLAAQGHYHDWLPLLRGPWLRKKCSKKTIASTGRPVLLPHSMK